MEEKENNLEEKKLQTSESQKVEEEEFKDFEETDDEMPEVEAEELPDPEEEEQDSKEAEENQTPETSEGIASEEKKDDFSSDIEMIKKQLAQFESNNASSQEETSNEEAPKENLQEDTELSEAKEESGEENVEEASKESVEEKTLPQISEWEEFDNKNSVVKKYIIYISKDFVPYIDNLSTDERSAYINDAIQKKLDLQEDKKEESKKKRILTHIVIAILTFLIMSPIAILCINKAILVTFENYKYSQDNFEKLYRHRFEKDKAYMRSVEYNRRRAEKKAN